MASPNQSGTEIRNIIRFLRPMPYAINIAVDGLTELLAMLEAIKGFEKLAQGLTLGEVQVDTFPASGASEMLILLKPTQSLLELVATARAGKIERRVG